MFCDIHELFDMDLSCILMHIIATDVIATVYRECHLHCIILVQYTTAFVCQGVLFNEWEH